ncbi:ABC transporter permease [Paenibacillus plantarum]|nr:ABC transporter permease subunit [Paenibacillus plantarum]
MQVKSARKQGMWHELGKNRWGYLMALPGIVFLLMFSYLPMSGLVLAFKDYNRVDGIFGSPWNGLRNFESFVTSSDVLRVGLNTLYLNALFIIFGTLAQITVSILLHEAAKKWFKKLAQSLLFFPYFVSWVVVGELVYSVLSKDFGSLDKIIAQWGLPRMEWYTHPEYWRGILVFVYIWKWTGYGAIIYIAALTSIDPSYYEAATVDGANRWQQIKHITLPLLMPTSTILTLLAIGRICYGDFGMIFGIVKENGILMSTTDIVDTYVYRALRVYNDIGMSTAVGFVQSVMGFFLVFVSNRIARKIGDGTSLY